MLVCRRQNMTTFDTFAKLLKIKCNSFVKIGVTDKMYDVFCCFLFLVPVFFVNT